MRALYDSKSKLNDRGIKYLLSEENKYKTWLKMEGALALSQAKEGFIPLLCRLLPTPSQKEQNHVTPLP